MLEALPAPVLKFADVRTNLFARRHAALLLHFLDTAVFLRDGTGIQPGEGLPPPRQRQALRRIVDKLSPEAYLQTMLLRIFG